MVSKTKKIKIHLSSKEVTAHKLTVKSEIPMAIEAAWEKVITSALLEFVAKGKIKFIPIDGTFPEIWEEGRTISTRMIVYGFIPFGGIHTLYFDRIDMEAKVVETKEKNRFSQVWDHKITMRSIGENSIHYVDEIVIYGGLFTGFISWWAKSFYKHRQKRWQLLAKNELKRSTNNRA